MLFWTSLLTLLSTSVSNTRWRHLVKDSNSFSRSKSCFLTTSSSRLQSKPYEKYTAFKGLWCVRCSIEKVFETSTFTDGLMPPRLSTTDYASLIIKSPTSAAIVFWATWPDWFCWTFYRPTELPVAVVECEIQIADFRHCVIKLTNIELTDVFRTTRRWSMPEIMQISLGVLKKWAIKRCGLVQHT